MEKSLGILEESHRRFNILTGEWVQVSPHRARRPWQGKVEKPEVDDRPEYDENCYLCPGNTRASGEVNPQYTSTYSFLNDFAAIPPNVPETEMTDGLLRAKSERGICKVICFSPRHDLTMAELSEEDMSAVVKLWVEECHELSRHDFINHIQIFENKGEVMGCSNPHPHGQIWAQSSIPVEPAKKAKHQLEYYQRCGRSLLKDYLEQELKLEDRLLFENEHFVVLVPFWAVWPYEAMMVPRRKMARITELTASEMSAFGAAYRQLAIIYDNLFEASFPYSAGIHQAPFDGLSHEEWHWHAVFYPPLLRSATVKKFMVGYEMLANPQRDITAEFAAQRLRQLPRVHYKQLQEV